MDAKIYLNEPIRLSSPPLAAVSDAVNHDNVLDGIRGYYEEPAVDEVNEVELMIQLSGMCYHHWEVNE